MYALDLPTSTVKAIWLGGSGLLTPGSLAGCQPREFFSAVLVPFFLFWVFFQLGALLVPRRGNDLPEVGVKSFSSLAFRPK